MNAVAQSTKAAQVCRLEKTLHEAEIESSGEFSWRGRGSEASLLYRLGDYGEIFIGRDDIVSEGSRDTHQDIASGEVRFTRALVRGYAFNATHGDMRVIADEISRAYDVAFVVPTGGNADFFQREVTDPGELVSVVQAVTDAHYVLKEVQARHMQILRDYMHSAMAERNG